MKIAFVSQFDPADVRPWSGTVHHMMRALADSGLEIEPIGPLTEPAAAKPWLLAKHAFHKLMRQSYARDRERPVLRAYARQVSARLQRSRCDVVLSPSSIPIAYLDCPQPIVLWSDSTFAAMFTTYWTDLAGESLRKGLAMERQTLTRSRLAIFSSHWAARSALALGAEAAKVKVVEYGANLDPPPAPDRAAQLISRRVANLRQQCELLFIGVDWQRKGGAMAVQVLRELQEILRRRLPGVTARLTIVGCQPTTQELSDAGGLSLTPDSLNFPGFISKQTPEGRQRLDDLLAASRFLLLPSRAEAYGLVFAEANAFGVPCLATDVGGIPTIIRDGINGHAFPLSAAAREWAQRIADSITNAEDYERMCRGSVSEFQQRLNWPTAAKRVKAMIEELV